MNNLLFIIYLFPSRKLNRGISTLTVSYYLHVRLISSPLSATPRTKQDPQGIKFEAYIETKGIIKWYLTLKNDD